MHIVVGKVGLIGWVLCTRFDVREGRRQGLGDWVLKGEKGLRREKLEFAETKKKGVVETLTGVNKDVVSRL